ncbi:hypothetical protein E6R59_24435, partial [Klebsiella pneumoniae]
MDNGSGETVQDAQRGQNRQAEPGGEYFVYFWTGRAANGHFCCVGRLCDVCVFPFRSTFDGFSCTVRMPCKNF